jgi:hypothetical protein
MERARRLLAHQGGGGGAEDCAAAAGRVYDKLHAHLAPLVGASGVEALIARSMKLTHSEFPFLEVPIREGSTKLRECLHAQEPALAAESAAALFGTFFALIARFIGERLTTQALRSAWPTIEETASDSDSDSDSESEDALTGLGVTIMATVEVPDSYTDLRFSPQAQGIAFLTDAIIIQRYLEIDGELRRALAVVKVRSSQHSKELREYEISSAGGILIGKALKGYEGLLTGTPRGGERGT